jgi:hypothetical protein
MKFLLLLAASLPGISAFAPTVVQQQRVATLPMAVVDRRTVFANAAATVVSTVLMVPTPSLALNRIPADNEIVKEQRTVSTKLDVNNAVSRSLPDDWRQDCQQRSLRQLSGCLQIEDSQ